MLTFRLTNPTMLLLSAAATALLAAFAPGPFSLGGTALAQELPTDDPPVNFRITGYDHKSVVVAWEVPRDRGITNYVLQRYESDGSASPWDLNRIEDSTNGGAGHGQQNRTEPDTQYRYVLTLKDDSGTTIIEASVSVRTLPAPDPDPPTPDPDPPTPDPDPPTPDPSVSTDARLSSLSLSGIDFRLGDRLRPFSLGWTYYEASVAEDVTETTVSATVNHSGASYVIKLGGVIDDDGVIPLRMGISVITIAVTAEDGVTTRIYTVRVTRGELPEPPPQSTLATLSALTLSGIDFGTFDDVITSYIASVANTVTETTVTPTVKHSGASYVIKLNGVVNDDGVIPLAVGSNVITIEVTAEDGSTSRTYTIVVTRAAPTQEPPPPGTDEETPTPVTGDLPTDDPPVNFRITGYDHKSVVVAWEVPRDRGITNYVLQRYESDGSASLWDLNRIEDSTNGGAGHGQQNRTEPDTQYRYVLTLKDDSGTTIIEASVSVRTLPTPDPSETTDGTSTPDSSDPTDATLSSLSLSGIDLRLGDRLLPFSPGWTDYDASVAEHVAETTVTATVNNPSASYVVKLGGVINDDGVIPLRMGISVITVVVTAEDGVTTRIYTVRVTRGTGEPPPPDSNNPTGEPPPPDSNNPTGEPPPPNPNNPTGEPPPPNPKPTVELEGISSSHTSVRENDGQATTITLTVELHQAARTEEQITLEIVSPTKGKTAQRGEDFDATLDETLTIAQGRIEGTAQLILTPKDNTEADGDKAFGVQATSSSGSQALLNIEIADDEMDGGEVDNGEDDGEDDEIFAFVAAVEDQAYTAGTAITALELPEATGGEGEITYRVSELPAGLSFDAAAQTISGTPAAATDGAVEITYTAQDSAGAAISLTFSITVNPSLSFGLNGGDGGG